MITADTSGLIYETNSGNTDAGTAIDDYYLSNFLYQPTPGTVHKNQNINLHFSVTSSGTLYFEDRQDFSNVWSTRDEFELVSALSAVQTSQTIDIPILSNTYQFKLSSSANKADSWRLNRLDYLQNSIGFGRP